MKTRRANREKYVNQRTTYPCNTRVQKAGAYQDSYGMRQKQHCLCQNHSKKTVVFWKTELNPKAKLNNAIGLLYKKTGVLTIRTPVFYLYHID